MISYFTIKCGSMPIHFLLISSDNNSMKASGADRQHNVRVKKNNTNMNTTNTCIIIYFLFFPDPPGSYIAGRCGFQDVDPLRTGSAEISIQAVSSAGIPGRKPIYDRI